MTVIGLLHPGEMGAGVGATLARQGHDVLWASEGRSAETRTRAADAGLTDLVTVDALRAQAEVILSICPPHAAVEVAEQVRSFEGLYIDANAIAPNTMRGIAPIQPRLVDGGIVGPPPAESGSTRLYLSGPAVEEAAALFAGTTLDVRVVSDAIGAASAVKMTYAAWSKGIQAMLLGIRAVARAEGVESALLSEWEISQPNLEARSTRAANAALNKGWRWSGEMEEIAQTFTAAGLPAGFHLAAADIFARSPHGGADGEDPVEQILAALLGAGRDSQT